MNLILASGSPRRSEILKNAGYDFAVRVSSADETLPDEITPENAVKYLSEVKADAVEIKKNEVIVSADTVVAANDKILGKPRDNADAFKMLKMLSGKTHSVFTGVAIKSQANKTVFSVRTDVTFFELSDDEIERYILSGESSDKAGAYGIQGKAALFVEKINGDYLNVVGLPLSALARKLAAYGVTHK